MSAVLQQDGTVTGAISPSLIPLKLNMVGCSVEREMNDNVDATLARGYRGIVPYLDKFRGACSIVGSGPSIADTHGVLKLIRSDILAINGSLKYLLARGIVPKWAMLWDAAEIVEKFAVPHPEVTYLVAARCHPVVFEKLKDCRVVVWFAGGDHNIMHYMQRKRIDDPLINGGSAGVTRAMYLAVALGYRHLNLFGADSSYAPSYGSHIEGSLVSEKCLDVSIGNSLGARSFKTTPEWCSQVEEFRDIYHMFCHPQVGIGIDVYGDGMLPHMHRIMRAKEAAGKLWNLDGSMHASMLPIHTQSLEEKRNVANAGV